MSIANWVRTAVRLWPLGWGRPAERLAQPDVEVPMELIEAAVEIGAPPEFGIYVDPEDPLIGTCIRTYHAYEPNIARAIRGLLKPGQVFLDVGANIGFHTLVAARQVGPRGRVLAVEMSPVNGTLLRASLRHNGLTNVTLFPCAAAEKPGQMTFCVTPKSGNGMLVNPYLEERIEKEPEFYSRAYPVRAMRIDDLLPRRQRIDLIKMDIEGSEPRALAGMTRLLARNRPPIIFEFHYCLLRDIGGINPTDLLDRLRGYGYAIHRVGHAGEICPGAMANDEVLRAITRPDGQPDLIDLIAIPPGN